MNLRTHRLDVDLTAIPDQEIEEIWCSADLVDPDLDTAILRQLVLRALPVIEGTIHDEGVRLGFAAHEGERACDEVAARLFVRLRRDRKVKNVRALAPLCQHRVRRSCSLYL